MTRVYLDWNATAPLRTEARNAMGAAMDVCGNPSSIHLEGRAARKIVEHARLQVAQALGAGSADIVFTSGATEAAALALAERGLHCAPVEHPCVTSWCKTTLPCDHKGKVTISDPPRSALQAANSETGVVQDLPGDLGLCDFVQAVGKIPVTFERSRAAAGLLSAHKFGGPKGVGALLLQPGLQIEARQKGGGQELGRRSGTQNVIGIAGMGAAAEAALRDLEDGRMREVGDLRDFLESRLADEAPKAVFIARDAKRL
ncbi:MAG: cysteine desulfurase family protein, partial [Paracoccaceae bacterium]